MCACAGDPGARREWCIACGRCGRGCGCGSFRFDGVRSSVSRPVTHPPREPREVGILSSHTLSSRVGEDRQASERLLVVHALPKDAPGGVAVPARIRVHLPCASASSSPSTSPYFFPLFPSPPFPQPNITLILTKHVAATTPLGRGGRAHGVGSRERGGGAGEVRVSCSLLFVPPLGLYM
jgi:hypothetical protein